MTTPAPLRFYLASATKRICFDSGFVEANARMYLAKWQNLYVIAKDAANFFIVTEEKAPEFVKTERDEKNELKVATDGPVILPVGSAFEWTVECGSTCPDGCDETMIGTATRTTKEEALALAAQWDGTQVRGARDFIRVRGPAFYQIKRPTPRPAPVVVPPVRPATNAPTIRNSTLHRIPRNYTIPRWIEDDLNETITAMPRADWNEILYDPNRNPNRIDYNIEYPQARRSALVEREARGRITEEFLRSLRARSLRAFQESTVTPAPVSVPEPATNPTRSTPDN